MSKKFKINFVSGILIGWLNLLPNSTYALDSIYEAYWYEGIQHVEVYFSNDDSPIKVDWKSLIPNNYASISAGPIPSDFLTEFNEKKSKDQYSRVKYLFTADLPTILRDKYFYLINHEGVNEIKMKNVEVNVLFELLEDEPRINNIYYWGYLISNETEISANGFVLISDTELSFKTSKLDLKVGTVIMDSVLSGRIEISSPAEQVALSYSIYIDKTNERLDFVSLNNLTKIGAYCEEKLYLILNDNYPEVFKTNLSKCYH
jgi:hypothetical protein